MGGFNPINIIVNTIGIVAANYVKNNSAGGQQATNNNAAQNSGAVTNGGNISQTTNSSIQTYGTVSYSASSYSTTASTLSSINQTIISTVEVEQRANYIKDLLNLPRDFQSLINQIQGGINSGNMSALSGLLMNGKINLGALNTLLSENSKEAVQKLMMTIMNVSRMGSNDVSQLKELMGMFSVSASSQETAQVVKNLLILYLPWLPLSVRNDLNLDFDIDIFDKIQGADPDSEEGAEIIKIMIQTANYGNVMATLEMSMNMEVEVFISAIESFPENEVLKRFEKENKKGAIRSHCKVEKNKDPENSAALKQNISITSSNYVSPKLIQAAHSLIKIVIDVDSSNFIINEETEG